MRRILCYSLIWLLCVACNKADSIDYEQELAKNLHSIAYLKAYGKWEQTTLRQSFVVRGTVTANDRMGELFHRIIIEDATGGIQVALIGEELYRRYPIGTRLYIHCNGLTLRNMGGRIELGDTRDPYGRFGLMEEHFDRHLRPERGAIEEPTPHPCLLDELSADWVDRYIVVEGVSFPEADHHVRWCATPAEADKRQHYTLHPIVDTAGGTATVSVLGTAHYADEPLPEGKGSLYAVVDRFDDQLLLRVVNYGVNFE